MTAREYVELVRIRDDLASRAKSFVQEATEANGREHLRAKEAWGKYSGYQEAARELSVYLARIGQPGGIT